MVQLARRTLRSPNVLLASDLLEAAIVKFESMLADADRAQQLHETRTATAVVARRGRQLPPEGGERRDPEGSVSGRNYPSATPIGASSPDSGTCRTR